MISEHLDELHEALEVPPQTNEVGRSSALLAGLFDVVAATGERRIRLLEIGASAGLNLLVDRFRFEGAGWHFGPGRLAAGAGRTRSWVRSSRSRSRSPNAAAATCTPWTPRTAEGRLLLTSFVWPFDVDRHQRLAAALRIAADHPVHVDRQRPATGWRSNWKLIMTG